MRAIKRTIRNDRISANEDAGGKQKTHRTFSSNKISMFGFYKLFARILRGAKAIIFQRMFYKFKKIAIKKKSFIEKIKIEKDSTKKNS